MLVFNCLRRNRRQRKLAFIELIYRPGSPLRSRYEQVAKKIRSRMPEVFAEKELLLKKG